MLRLDVRRTPARNSRGGFCPIPALACGSGPRPSCAACRPCSGNLATILALQELFARFGYGVPLNGTYDAATMDVVTAFQRHFRPERVDGIADTSTLTTLNDLLALMPKEEVLTS